MEFYYVDTASTAGTQDGTSRTHGNSGTAAFESLFTAEATLDADATYDSGLVDDMTIKCAGSTADTTAVVWNAFGSTAAYTLTIMGDDAATDNDGKYDGPLDWSTSHYRMEVAGNDCLYCSITDGVIVDGLQLQVTGTTNTQYGLYFLISSAPSYAANFTVKNCRIWGSAATTSAHAFACGSLRGTETLTVENNLFITRSTGSSRGTSIAAISGASGLITLANNTSYSTDGSSSIGLYINRPTGTTNDLVIANCATPNHNDDINAGGAGTGTKTITNCACNPGEGTNPITLGTLTDEFVDVTGTLPGQFDFTPKSGSQLYHAADLTYSPTLDGNGRTRHPTTPSVGAVEGAWPDLTTGVQFDGTTDFYKNSDMSGSADGRKGTLAMLIKFDETIGVFEQAFGFSCSFGRSDAGILRIRANAAGGVKKLQLESTGTTIVSGTWYRVLCSWDLTNAATSSHLYVDGVDVNDALTLLDDADIDYTKSYEVIGAASDTPTNQFQGCIADFWFSQGECVDFSVEANRLKFFDYDGNLVAKGDDGSTPTTTAPIIYLTGGVHQFGQNHGTGSEFVVDSGASPVDCTIVLPAYSVGPKGIVMII